MKRKGKGNHIKRGQKQGETKNAANQYILLRGPTEVREKLKLRLAETSNSKVGASKEEGMGTWGTGWKEKAHWRRKDQGTHEGKPTRAGDVVCGKRLLKHGRRAVAVHK